MTAVAALAVTLGACTSQLDLADSDAQRPAVSDAQRATAPPPANEAPAARDTKPMSAEERQRISEELAAARERLDSQTTGTVPAQTPRPNSR